MKVIAPLTVVDPETVKLNPPTERVAPVEMVTFVQAEAAFNVTILPLPSIMTLSPATGYTPFPTCPPPDVYDHVPLAVQLPD